MLKCATMAVLLTLAFAASGQAAPTSKSSSAVITGSFGDACRDFTAQSTKDVSHVEIHYRDGRVVKDETTIRPSYAIDGDHGDEIDSVAVKSGTTIETFTCPRASTRPIAVLEVNTPESCFTWPDGLVVCDGRAERTSWTRAISSTQGHGSVEFFCQWPEDLACVLHEMPCGQLDGYSLCRITYTFRGTSSTDLDGDLAIWYIDFGDGTSTSGNWITNPPTEVSHEYLIHYCPTCSRDPAILTVTDSAGHTDSDALFAFHQYPD